ncbi:MAG: hypothetical protein CL605_03600 [Altibacter sp.]|nr:hypothetical protein [Altibacter sp.]
MLCKRVVKRRIRPITMRATLTSDLFHKGSEKLVIKTCAEMLNYMPQIYGFIKDIGVEAKLTSNMYDASIVIRGETLMPNIDKIVRFIESHGWQKN